MAKQDFKIFGGYFDLDSKDKQLKWLQTEMHQAAELQDLQRYQDLAPKHRRAQGECAPFFELKRELEDWEVLWELVGPQSSESLQDFLELKTALESIEEKLERLTWLQRFKPEDNRPCYVDIVAGSGGIEAQDWAQMLLRMYLKWADLKKLQSEVISLSEAESAGIKSATLKLSGDYAFGWMKTESGVHRLVRCSPFDANHRRHTSFAAVYVTPVVEDEDKSPELNLSECRVDVFRASGAGGQHVNKTESAVRITHLPTGLVVQSQADRSQHRNKEQCIQQLKAKLHQRRLREREEQQKSENAAKPAVSWGSQIRSYVLDDARVKDLRTGVESRNPSRILEGDLEAFVLAALDQGAKGQPIDLEGVC